MSTQDLPVVGLGAPALTGVSDLTGPATAGDVLTVDPREPTDVPG